ncbi:MAG: RIP metalloprotease RseP [Acidobacteriota bacterium]
MPALPLSILSFLISLGLIVVVHEAGHYLAARLFGVRVLVFSVGFGKRLIGFRRGDTDYRLAAIPLGGYVHMGGHLPGEQTGDPSDFQSKPRWQRIIIYLAGPAMNLVLAVFLVAFAFTRGIEAQGLADIPPVVGKVLEDSAGEAAGIEAGDRVIEAAGEPVATWSDVDFAISTSPEKPVPLRIERGTDVVELEVVPTRVPRYELGDAGLIPKVQVRVSGIYEDSPADLAGFEPGDVLLTVDGGPISTTRDVVDRIGPNAGRAIVVQVARGETTLDLEVVPAEVDGSGRIGIDIGIYERLSWAQALPASVAYNIETLEKILQVLGKLFTRDIAPQSALSGPIEIAAWTGRALNVGFKYLIFLMGFLSLSIGVMNLLPIPVLDGGHIAILLFESVLRRDLSLRVKERVTQVGFVLLMMLMTAAIIFDLLKNLPWLFGDS